MPNLLEQLVDELNRAVFFREFSFSRNQFFPTIGQSKEFADHVVWLGESLIVFQVKERDVKAGTSADEERTWFKKKVIAKASKQVRETIAFLDGYSEIPIVNQHGQTKLLNSKLIDRSKVVKIVLYRESDELPDDCRECYHYISRSAGYNFLHVLPWNHYLGVCRTLVTPSELIAYFAFRQTLLERIDEGFRVPSEQALLGQFLSGELSAMPSDAYVEYFMALDRDDTDYNLGWLLHRFREKIDEVVSPNGINDYQLTLAELAKLNRNELKQVSFRLRRCAQAALKGEFHRPTRFTTPRTGCGFLFVTVEPDWFVGRLNFLAKLVSASMYEQLIEKHVGAVLAQHDNGFTMDWCYANHPPVIDEETKRLLDTNYPFHRMKAAKFKSYSFYSDL